jgi:hypothetical protein
MTPRALSGFLPLLLVCALVPVLNARCTSPRPTRSAPTPAGAPVTLYFPATAQTGRVTDCGTMSAVTRPAGRTAATPEQVLRLLLAGPTPTERSQGLEDPFQRPLAGWGEAPLLRSLTGVLRVGETAVVSFRAPAMAYLNGAACVQEALKTSIERTLQVLPGIRRVVYSVDGQVVDEWDA